MKIENKKEEENLINMNERRKKERKKERERERKKKKQKSEKLIDFLECKNESKHDTNQSVKR